MKIKKLNIHDAFEFNFPISKDHRGLFFRTYCKKTLKEFKIVKRQLFHSFLAVPAGDE